MLPAMRDASVLIADQGYDADWFCQALRARGTRSCIADKAGRSIPVRHGKMLFRDRRCIEFMFGRLKNRRCIATR